MAYTFGMDDLSLEQKIALLSGRSQWETESVGSLPSIRVADGPYGLRKEISGKTMVSEPATCFPTSSAQAATWNPELIQRMGAAIGREAQAASVHVVLGPGVNMKRSPLGGRNFEYFSEDPILASQMACAFIDGVQSEGVGTSLKHFAANNQEYERMTNSSQVDERTLREIYLRAFELTIKRSQPWSVMASYNKINGEYVARSRRFLHDILKSEWGFKGIVVSDWGAAAINRPATIRAGLHLEMPGKTREGVEEVVQAVSDGMVSKYEIATLVNELIPSIERIARSHRSDLTYSQTEHHALAAEVAAEAITLLKNNATTLPLAKQYKKVAIIGRFAKESRYRGAGSSQVVPTSLDCAYNTLVAELGAERVLYEPGYTNRGETSASLRDKAKKAAKQADVTIIFAGLPASYESEGSDRTTLDLPEGHNTLIQDITTTAKRTVVVLTNGSAVTMPWLDNVDAVLEGWLGGQAGGSAIAKVLIGAINPSGRLSETFPLRLQDTPSYPDFPGRAGLAHYHEGIYIGYRHYITRDISPLFPFGHGLSYTTFEYGKATISAPNMLEGGAVTVGIKVTNTGKQAGKEVVQLYIGNQTGYEHHPSLELKQFKKIHLEPNESQTVTFTLSSADFEYYSERYNEWHVDPGTYRIAIGASVADIRSELSLEYVTGTTAYPVITKMSLVKDLALHPHGKVFYDLLIGQVKGGIKDTGKSGTEQEEAKAVAATTALMLESLPLAALPKMSEGMLTNEFIDAMVTYCHHAHGFHLLDTLPLVKAVPKIIAQLLFKR